MASAKIHVQKFEDMILRRGRIVKWQEAVLCSCWNTDSGQPYYECQACKGLGYTYAPAIEDIALVMSVTHEKDFNDMVGVFEIGDAIMTVGNKVPEVRSDTGLKIVNGVGRTNPLYQVGMHDLITLTDDDYKTSELLIRGVDLYGRPADTLLNEDVLSVTLVSVANPLTGEITTYEQGLDYQVDGNKIEWCPDRGPDVNTQYAVRYHHRPTFTIFTNLPTPRYQDGAPLPRKVALRYRGTLNARNNA